jgi:CopG family nickel-responsive transcriptional regulator
MAELVRTGVSIERELLEGFDKLIAKRGYGNRSEALRDLIRDALVADEVSGNKPVIATLSMVYDHHRPDLTEKLTQAQHHHLDEQNCFEVVIMKGPAGEVKHLADHMLSLRGVKHGKLVMTSAGKALK